MPSERIAPKRCKAWTGSAPLPDLRTLNYLQEVQFRAKICDLSQEFFYSILSFFNSIVLNIITLNDFMQVFNKPRMLANK